MKTFIFFLGLAIAAQAQTFEVHTYKDTFPKTRFEMCRELASVKAESVAKTKEEKTEIFQETYERCMKTDTGEI